MILLQLLSVLISLFTMVTVVSVITLFRSSKLVVPIDMCKMNVLYVFVDIKFDLQHFVDTVKFNFPAGSKLSLVGTIQFASSLHVIILTASVNITRLQKRY